MSIEYIGGYCETCKANRKLERKAPNHILHLLLTIILGIFTAGIGAIIWIIVWILVSIRFGGWICSTCGSNNVKAKTSLIKLFIYISIAIIFISIGNLTKKELIEKKEVASNIESKYEILTNNLTRNECADEALNYLFSKFTQQVNINVIKATYIPKDKLTANINILFEENEIKKSFTAICIKNENKIKIEELELTLIN